MAMSTVSAWLAAHTKDKRHKMTSFSFMIFGSLGYNSIRIERGCGPCKLIHAVAEGQAMCLGEGGCLVGEPSLAVGGSC